MTCVSLPYIYWYGQQKTYIYDTSTVNQHINHLSVDWNFISIVPHYPIISKCSIYSHTLIFVLQSSRNYLLQALITNINTARSAEVEPTGLQTLRNP